MQGAAEYPARVGFGSVSIAPFQNAADSRSPSTTRRARSLQVARPETAGKEQGIPRIEEENRDFYPCGQPVGGGYLKVGSLYSRSWLYGERELICLEEMLGE